MELGVWLTIKAHGLRWKFAINIKVQLDGVWVQLKVITCFVLMAVLFFLFLFCEYSLL